MIEIPSTLRAVKEQLNIYKQTGALVMDIVFSSTLLLAAAIQTRKVSAVEVLEAHLTQIERHNPRLNAIITLDADHARERRKQMKR